MAIRKVETKDLNSVARLLKRFFPKHNRFNKSEDEIITYLTELMHKPSYQSISPETPLYLYDEDGEVKGVLALIHFDGTSDGDHRVWKFRHFAFTSEEIGSKLLNEVEEVVKTSSTTSKIELTIAESEPYIEFYKTKGYEQQAALTNHYRYGETCFIFCKSFP